MRQRALGLIGKLLTKDPNLAQQLAESAETGLKDQKWNVRKSVLELFTRLVEESPDLAQQLLEFA